MRRSLGLFACVLLVFAVSGTGLPAQSRRPDFSGHWTETSGIPPTGGPFWSGGTITQDGATLTLANGSTPISYRLDGRETVSSLTTVRGETWRLVSQARWITNALLVTTQYDAGLTGQWEDLAVFSLDATGHLNIVTVTTLKSDQPTMATKQLTYRKN